MDKQLSIKVKVDTTEIDEAMDKIKTLNQRVVFIKSDCSRRDEDLISEQNRIEELTGMKVCILKPGCTVIEII